MTADLATLAQQKEWAALERKARICPRANEAGAKRELKRHVNMLLEMHSPKERTRERAA